MKEPEVLERPRLRKRWIVLTALGIVLLICAGLFVATKLLTPPVQEPFDIQAFIAASAPPAENAFDDYIAASKLLKSRVEFVQAEALGAGVAYEDRRILEDQFIADIETSLSSAKLVDNPSIGKWLDANAAALATWKSGTQKSAALYIRVDELLPSTLIPVVQDQRELVTSAAMQGLRLESQGEVAEAAEWYRAIQRASRHFAMKGVMVQRLVSFLMHKTAATAWRNWSQNASVTAEQLQTALQHAIEDDTLTPPLSETLRVDYMMFHNSLALPLKEQLAFRSSIYRSTSRTPFEQGWDVAKIYMSEPQHSHSVGAEIYANWLKYIDMPRAERTSRKVEGTAIYSAATGSPSHNEHITFGSMMGPPILLDSFWMDIESCDRRFLNERALQASLLVTLAVQWYHRDHGEFPDNLELLSGKYLDMLPVDPFSPTGAQMIYRRTPEGAIVYSVGDDAVDSGGDVADNESPDVGFQILTPR